MATQTIALSPDEIRTAFSIRDRYLQAQARLTMAAEMEEEYFEQLRRKYGLDGDWQCLDLLIGFECEPKAETDDKDD